MCSLSPGLCVVFVYECFLYYGAILCMSLLLESLKGKNCVLVIVITQRLAKQVKSEDHLCNLAI